MKNKKIAKNRFLKSIMVAIVATSLVGFTACTNDDDNDEATNNHSDAWGDAFIKKWKITGNAAWGINAYAGGEGLSSATIESPDGNTYTLAEFWKGAGNMRYHAQESDSDTVKSSEGGSYSDFAFGDWKFTLTFNDGTSKTITDTISESDGDIDNPVNLSSAVTHDGSSKVTIVFSEPGGTSLPQRYIVKLTDEETNESKPLYACQFTEYHADFGSTGYVIEKGKKPSESNSNTSCSADSGWKRASEVVAGLKFFTMVVGVRFEADQISGTFSHSNAYSNRHMVYPSKYPTSAASEWGTSF